MKKKIRKLCLCFAVMAILLLAYLSIPRVKSVRSSYGTPLDSSDLLPVEVRNDLRLYVETKANNAQAVVIINDEKVIFESGDTSKLINCHSARKSLMSLLIGIAMNQGLLSLDQTLGELGINESRMPLTVQEKSATIRDLITARSGIYLPAEAETDFAKNNRPQREQYKPGEFFFYNNFDFNVLGAILEQRSGKSIGQFMEQHLAKPIGLQDFASSNVVYGNPWPIRSDNSDYRVYWMFLSARDLARIGAVVAQNGVWNGKEIVSKEWIDESLEPHTSELHASMKPFDAYGYLWWIDQDNQTVWADGYGGQFLMVDRSRNLVLCQRNFTGNSLLSSGLFLLKKNKDGWRTDLMHLFDEVKEFVPRTRDRAVK